MSRDAIAGYVDPIGAGDERAQAPDSGAAQVPSAAVPEVKALLGLAVSVVVIAALYFGRDVLIPITLALLLSFILSPVVDLIRRTRLWRAPSVLLAVLFAIGVLGAAATLIGGQAAQLSADAPRYATTIETKVRSVQGFATAELASFSKLISHDRPTPQRRAAPQPRLRAQPGIVRPVPVEVHQPPATPLEVARSILEPVLAPLETLVIVLVVAIFVLLQKEDLRDRFIRLFGSNDLHRTTMAIDDAGRRLSKYFLSQLGVNASFGAVIGLGLWAIGVPQPALWGILAGLLRFVPYIGSFIALIPPLALAAAIDPGWAMMIETGALFFLVEPLIGYGVEPMLYGHSTGLSPVSVVVAAVFWTWIWGPIGLILSTPLTLCLVVMGRHVKSLEFFDVLLGDRPALTPVESFYQRLLGGNADAAHDHAEELLEDRPLLAYYDGVVVPGLRLAAEDAARGTLGNERTRAIARSMRGVIGELADHRDVAPTDAEEAATLPPDPAWAMPGSVVCIAGRGAFDDTVAAMLAQLLAREEIGARAVRFDAATRETIGSLDLAGARLVCLTYLELGTPSAVRTLARRVRERAPDAAILVGLRNGDAPEPAIGGAEPSAATLADMLRLARETSLGEASARAA